MRSIYRRFKQHFLKASSFHKNLPVDWMKQQISRVGTPTSIQFTMGPIADQEIDYFLILTQRFLDAADPLYYKKVWQQLQIEFANELTPQMILNIETAIRQMEGRVVRLPPSSYSNNATSPITPATIFQWVQDGIYSQTDPAYRARMLILALQGVPISLQMITFCTYVDDAIQVASHITDAILAIESTPAYKTLYPTLSVNPCCIYCGSANGVFGAEEHIIPEALGNDELVLPPGYVCDQCNHQLSYLDQSLANYGPLAFLQPMLVPLTKRPQYPHTKLQGGTIARTGPSEVTFKGEKSLLEVQELGGGVAAWTSNGIQSGNTRMMLRALHKIALAAVSLQEGHGAALDARYDRARAFIQGEQDVPNNTWFASKVKAPRLHFDLHVTHKLGNTTVLINIYGLRHIVHLEQTPVMELPNELAKSFVQIKQQDLPVFRAKKSPRQSKP